MKNTNKNIWFIMAVVMITLLFTGCQKQDNITSGTTPDQINEVFPAINGVESCRWYYERISKDGRLSVGPNTYAFYGEITLSEAYFSEITAQYEWTKSEEATSDDYLDEIAAVKQVYVSEEYETVLSDTDYIKVLLDKENRVLYFYRVQM